MANVKRFLKNGGITSIYAAATQGMHNVLLGLIFMFGLIATLNVNNQFALNATISTFIEGFMFIFAIILYLTSKFIFKKNKDMKLKLFLITKEGIWTAVSGVIGGGVGSTAIVFGVNYAGDAYGTVLSALFPVIAMLITFFFLKDKLNIYGLVGLLFVTVSAILITVIGQDASSNATHLLVGIFLGFLGGVCWALEASIVSIVFRKSKVEPSDETLIITREFGSFLSLILLIIPMISFSTGTHSGAQGYSMMGEVFKNAKVFFSLMGVGLNLHLSWWAYYNAIKHMGATKATSMNVTYIIWTPVLSAIVYSFVDPDQLNIPTWSYWVFSISMIIGIIVLLNEHVIKKFISTRKQ